MRPTYGKPTTGQPTGERATVPEAAEILGLSEDAVRSRLKRGTLRKEKAPDGTVLVMLGGGDPTDRQTTNSDRQTTGQPTRVPWSRS